MAKLKTLFASSVIALSTLLSNPNVNADTKKSKAEDPVMNLVDSSKAGLKDLYVFFYDNLYNTRDSLRTDSLGYFTLHDQDTTIEQDTTVNFNLNQGWNLVSLPLRVQDSSKANIFPLSNSSLFNYDNGYLPQNALTTTKGYWLKAPSQNVQITGKKIHNDTINVKTGWNLIGSLSTDKLVSNISSSPDNIRTSNVFGYDFTYVKKDTIKPGNAYWVKVDQDGQIVLNDNVPSNIPGRNNFSNDISELPLPPSEPFSKKASGKTLSIKSIDNKVLFSEKASIYDILGRKVITQDEKELNLRDLSSGVYFYQVNNGNGMFTGMLNNLEGKLVGYTLPKEINNIENRFLLHKETIDKNINETKPLSKGGIGTAGSNSTKRFRLEIRDELDTNHTPSGIGQFNDIVQEADSLNEFQNKYQMIYNFPITSSYKPNFLSLFKAEVFNAGNANGDTLLLAWLSNQKHPYKIFHNRTQAPDTGLFNSALDELLNEIKDSTQINYRNNVLPKLNLFEEISAYDDRSINMDYTGNLSATIPEYFNAPNGSGLPTGNPANATVKINKNQTDHEFIKYSMAHELVHHAFKGEDNEPVNPTETNYPVPRERIYDLILIQVLDDYTNLSRYVQE
jgi:hypothetical protein